MKRHKEFVKQLRKNPAVEAEYEALREEFALFDELLKARRRAGLTQADVARHMGTKAPAIARLERSGGTEPSPTLQTLRRYAEAVGCRLEVRLRPVKSC